MNGEPIDLGPDGPSRELCEALEGDRSASLEFWKAAARWDFNDETKVWIQHIAERVIEANAQLAKRRPDAMLKAIGMAGREDESRHLFDEVHTECVFLSFCDGDDGSPLRTKMLEYLERHYPNGNECWRSWLDREWKKRKRG
jgi:hypothetical protein